MKNLILKIFTFTIILGVCALAINSVFGRDSILFLQKQQVDLYNGEHFYIWRFDWVSYVKNLQTTAANASILEFKLPERQFNNDFINNLGVILNYIIVIINLLLYPIKLGAYLAQNVLAIFGVNTTYTSNNGLYWLVTLFRDILGNIAIPYV